MRTFKKSWIFLLAFIFLLGFGGCSQKSDQPTGEGQLRKDKVYLSGTVDTSGAQKDGVLITATEVGYIPGSSTTGSYTTQTNTDGYYALAVPAGVYNVTAEGRGLQKAIRNSVRFLDPVVNLDFILTATGDLTGRITYHQGSMEGLVVFLYGTQFMAFTDQTGTYKITGIPIGPYRLGVVVPGDSGSSGSGGSGGGRPLSLTDPVVIKAGELTTIPTKDGSEIGRYASIDYVNPYNIEQSRDPNHPAIIHRWDLFNDHSNLSYPDPGILVKFDRPMDAKSFIEGETVVIEAPAAFATPPRNLRWKFEWGTYYYTDEPGSSYDNGLEINGLSFSPSACNLTITPRDENDHVAAYEMPVGKYVIRIKNAVKDKDGNQLYREYVYAFEIQEMMYSTVGASEDNNFLPNGAAGIDVGDYVAIGFTNHIDKSTVDLSGAGATPALTITPALAGKKVIWDEDSEIRIYGLYAENTSYTIKLATAGIRTINNDPIVNRINSAAHDDLNFGPVGQEFTVQFTTAAPKVAAIFPKNDSRENGICEPVTLVFNTVTDRDSVEKHIHVWNDSNVVDMGNGVDIANGKAVEILPCQDNDSPDSPASSYKLTWVANTNIPYPDSANGNNGTNGNNGNNGTNDNSNNCECNSAACAQHIGDALIISFPRQYKHAYRVVLDGDALSFTGKKIAAIVGSFRTKVPHLVDQNVDDGDTIGSGSGSGADSDGPNLMDGLYFRYNVGVDISHADFVLTTDNAAVPKITLGIQSSGGGAFNLRPQSLPCSAAFTLTMKNIKADDDCSVLPDQTFHFSTGSLRIVGTTPAQGAVDYYLNPDGTGDMVTVRFNGKLTEGMQDAVKNSLDIIGSFYGTDVAPGTTVPDNYPVPILFWSDWGYGWSMLQITFTMDPCTNYRVHVNTDPATRALLYDDDQNPATPDVPFLYDDDQNPATPNVPFLCTDKDLVFTTMCRQEGEGESPLPELLYSTSPAKGSTDVSLDNKYIQLYFTPPYINSGLDLEILAGATPLVFNEDYTIQYPYYSYSSIINVCINKLQPATTYQVKVKGIDIPSSYTSPLHNNLVPDPYIFSFTTEPAKIMVTADNARGVLTFTANSGYFNPSILQALDTLSLKPNLRADGVEWKFYRGEETATTDEGDDYANRAELYYKPAQYALIEVRILKKLDRWILDEVTGATQDVQFVNTPGKWLIPVSPDITLPRLEKVEQAGNGHHDYIRLYFNVAVDANTALDPSHYSITYKDDAGETRTLAVQRALTYGCLQDNQVNNVWDPNKCDPDNDGSGYQPLDPADSGSCIQPLDPDGQVVLKTDPQSLNTIYTLTITGVKNASQRYVITPGKGGTATFEGYEDPGHVDGVFLLETMNDIAAVFDHNWQRYQWKVLSEKIAIHFTKPMDGSITAQVVQQGAASDAAIVISPAYYYSGQDLSLPDQYWYDSNTTLVVTCNYEVESGNYPPGSFNIKVTDKCLNAEGRKLENTTPTWNRDNQQVNQQYMISPIATAWFDPAAPFEPADPPVATIKLDYTGITGLSPALILLPGRYRLVDPTLFGAPAGEPNVLDGSTPPVPVTVTSVKALTSPGHYLLTLSGYPALTVTDPILVYSDLPAIPPLPPWFPMEALKDVGYSHLLGQSGT